MSPRKITNILLTEFVGTFVLSLAFMAMLVRTNFSFFSALGAAFVYGLFMLVFGSKIVAHLNPAVTIGLWTVRKINTLNAFVYVVLQVAAGYSALRVGQYFLNTTLAKTAKPGFDWRVMIAEGLGALVFALAIAAAMNHSDRQLNLHEKSILIGLGLFVGVVVASLAGNGIVNPAIAISLKSFSWAYMLGPIIGAIVGFNLYDTLLVKNFKVGNLLSADGTVFSAKPVATKSVAKKIASKTKKK
ncbi:MAG TPA: aquaporin [Candidatus Dormibacteraeota bacterium]|nr:aquaporin [Candidatus Dormibacteraeota bacterium]